LSVRRKESQRRIVILSVPGFDRIPHELDVLLRHRRRSISL